MRAAARAALRQRAYASPSSGHRAAKEIQNHLRSTQSSTGSRYTRTSSRRSPQIGLVGHLSPVPRLERCEKSRPTDLAGPATPVFSVEHKPQTWAAARPTSVATSRLRPQERAPAFLSSVTAASLHIPMSSVVNGSGDAQDGQSSLTATTGHTAQESGRSSTAGHSQLPTGPKAAMTWAERLAGSSTAKRANAAVQAQATSSISTGKAVTPADISQALSSMHLDNGAGTARQGRPDQAVPDTGATAESASAATGRTGIATDSGWGELSENGSKKETAESSSAEVSGATSGAGMRQSIPAAITGSSQAASSPEPAPKASPAPSKPNIWQVRRQEAEKKLAEQAAQREKDASVQPLSAPADSVPAQQSEGATAAKKKMKAQKKKDSALEKGSPANGAPAVNQSNPASWPSPLEEKARGEERQSRERESRERQREDSTAQSVSSTGTSSPSVEKRKRASECSTCEFTSP